MRTQRLVICLLLLGRQAVREAEYPRGSVGGRERSLGMDHVAEGYKTCIGLVTEPAVNNLLDVVRVDLSLLWGRGEFEIRGRRM
jgi:hypothetical protein